MLNDKLEKLTSEHMVLQATNKELEYSHEKLVESHAILDIAHEVVLSTVKSIQPLTHTCTCSHVNIEFYCAKPCCSQASQSSIEHVFVESCDDLIAQENDELKQEVEKLKKDLSELKEKSKVQPSQDNRTNMVKKLERGSNVTSSTPQQQIKNNKNKIQVKNRFEHIKCYQCSKMGHFASHCPTKLKAQEIISKKHGSSIKRRLCYQCKEKGHSAVDCPQVRRSDQGRSDRPHRAVRLGLAKNVRTHCSKEKKEPSSSKILRSKQIQDNKRESRPNKDKSRVCYTCRQKGHMGKDCPNGNTHQSNLVHYDFHKLGKDKDATCAIRVISSPQISIRAIWVPKHLVTNLKGPKKIWVPKNAC